MPKILIGLFHLCSFLWQNAVAQLAVVILKLFFSSVSLSGEIGHKIDFSQFLVLKNLVG